MPLPSAGRRFLARFRSAPKVELHLHLEGSIAPATLVRLSGRSPRPIFPDLAALRTRQAGTGDIGRFLELYRDVCRCLSRPDDYAEVAGDLVGRLHRERIHYAEVYVSPAVVEKIGLPWPPVRDALERVFADHERRGRGTIRVLLDSVRQWGPGAANRVLDLQERSPWPRVAGFGLGGDEASLSARDFERVYARVRSLGLAPLVHAGESSGPESVAAALRWLRPVRIAHGIRAAEEPVLMRALARRGIACDVCPTSNVATSALPSIGDVARGVRALLASGVTVTVGTDDPGLFGTTLLGEFRKLAGAGLAGRELEELARGGRVASLSGRGRSRRR
ncbi:MAG: adenosine deaminase family protein [Acidithiobacillales bacterium]